MTRSNTPWTPEAERLFVTLFAQGLSHRLIAERLSAATGERVTRNASIAKAHRLGLRRASHDVSDAGPRGGRVRYARHQRAKPPEAKGPEVGVKPIPKARRAAFAPPAGEETVRFSDLPRGGCAWIYTGPEEPATADSPCCGRPVEPGGGLPYCPEHLAWTLSRSRPDAEAEALEALEAVDRAA